MNKKLIAMAVSAIVAGPVVAQADEMAKEIPVDDSHAHGMAHAAPSVTLYGRINNALDIKDVEGSDKTTDLSNVSSRFGIKYSADIGNGMTASARYEFATRTDRELHGGTSLVETAAGDISRDRDRFGLDTRLGVVGLSGAFGSITAGNQWSAFYNHVGTHLDPSYTLGYYLYSSLVGGPYRASNTVKYANSFGPVSLELDARFNESNEGNDVAEKLAGDGVGIGITINATENFLVALAIDSEDRDNDSSNVDRTGIAFKGTFGSFWASLSYQEAEPDGADQTFEQNQIWLGGKFGGSTSWNLGFGQADAGGDADPTAINYGVYHSLGGGLKAYVEGVSLDSDNASDINDIDRILLGMRIDF